MCSVNVLSLLPRSVIALGAVALVALSGACGGHYVSRGTDLYADGRYVEAAEVFERTEGRLADSSSSERARFGLYRGATFLKLGDAVHAARWLGYARSVVTQDPDALGSSDAALLEASLRTLASAKVPPVQKPQPELATAPADVPAP
jgi:thioredoxin-like negative regulator of GroEL